ncbi:hypothetical protein DB88DRAFT_168488 [Papiliotrema laurentii]|uniref:Uncharacterized protein n=1 Tax=Papiliotrema laurentii TaxID=5418 RepID=A0AAD9FUE9_PAPLA|nr:hypothetical protein DB88DRAFT_168488 [Papiliotrema laurentii]
MSPALRTPPSAAARDSTASAGGLAAIGSLLASPYDVDDDDTHEWIRTPLTPPVPGSNPFDQPPHYVPADSSTHHRPKMGRVRESRYQPPSKETLMKRIQSWEGVVDASRDSVYSQEDEMALPQPTRLSSRVPVRKCPSVGTAKDTPPIIVHFPRPTLVSPVNSSAPIRPAPPPRPRVQIPQTPIVSQSQRARPAPVEPYTIPELPCSGTPVSPHLALPPLTPPRSPFAVGSAVTGPGARGSTSSVASESIQGYDVMKEKKALFREGQEELLSPFSPRTTRQESGLRAGPRRGTNRGVSTVDFWKRFSVSVRLDQVAQAGEKQSAWLNDTRNKRKRVWWLVAIALLIIVVVVGAVVIASVLGQRSRPQAKSPAKRR